ncbi:MAG: hypothetical protein Fur0035_18190 [Anaerolineales bacterium]
MSNFFRAPLHALKIRPWLADFLALIGLGWYAAQLWNFAHLQASVLDEGLYLYKGLLLASGQYSAFQDFGLWMNQMPLAYLIYGWAQLIFGAGLRSGRIFAFALGLLTALGLFFTARRLGNRWTAALLLWALALNPAALRMSAMAASQGLTACLLAWTFFFSLGPKRRPWQLFLGGLLAGATVMVRINLILLLPLLAIYVWRANSRGLSALLAGMLLSFGSLHLLYWPNILRLWVRWLPLPFLAQFAPPPNTPTWNPESPLGYRVASLFLAFRYHFAALFGALAAWLFTEKENWRKEIIFLFAFLLSSFLLHAWASLGNDYCVFCFSTYTAFYAGAGLLLAALTLPGWNLNPSAPKRWLGGLMLVILLGGMAYSAEGLIRDWLPENFYRRLMRLPAPGFGGAEIWQVLVNKFGGDLRSASDAAQAFLPVIAAAALGLLILSAGKMSGMAGRWGRGLVLFLLAGTLFSSSFLLAGAYRAYDCPADVLPGYEAAGAALKAVIPPGAKIYWAGYSPAPLLYLPPIELLPGQLHGVYALRISPDDQALRRYGWWNESLAEKWLAQADFVIVEAGNAPGLAGKLGDFTLAVQTAPQSCQPDSALTVYRRK